MLRPRTDSYNVVVTRPAMPLPPSRGDGVAARGSLTVRLPNLTPRHEGEPVPDLTTHQVLHRAMCVDVRRMADLTAGFAAGATPGSEQRSFAIRDYLAGIFAVIRSHHEAEDGLLWPVIVAAAGKAVRLAGLAKHTADHQRLDLLLDRAHALTDELLTGPDDPAPASRLSAELRALSRLLDRHVADEERQVFPLIARHVRADDYSWVLQQSRSNHASALLPFVVPWVAHHATPDELQRMLADASWGMRVVLQIFEGRFAAHERLVFG